MNDAASTEPTVQIDLASFEGPNEPTVPHPDDSDKDSLKGTLSQSGNESFLRNESFQFSDNGLQAIYRQLRNLPADQMLALSEYCVKKSAGEAFANRQYTGSNWFLPEIVEVGPDEPRWAVALSSHRFTTTLAGMRMSIDLLGYLVRIACLCLLWLMLFFLLGSDLMELGGHIFDPVVTFVFSALVGGILARILQIPPLIAIIWLGIMWGNIPDYQHLVHGTSAKTIKVVRYIGLSVILLRAGLSINMTLVAAQWKRVLVYATLPMAIEGVIHSIAAQYIFKYEDWTWAFLQGFVVAGGSPTIVVPGSLYCQGMGHGTKSGPLVLMVSTVAIDAACAVWSANFIANLIFSNQSIGLAIALGPIQFIGGIIIGFLCGLIVCFGVDHLRGSAERLVSGRYSTKHVKQVNRFASTIIIIVAIGLQSAGYHFQLAGGGSLAVAAFGCTVANKYGDWGTTEQQDTKKAINHTLYNLWDYLVMPALFSLVGATVNLKQLFSSAFIGKGFACLAVWMAARGTTSVLIGGIGSDFSFKEKIILALGVLGKSTVHVALGGTALTLATAAHDVDINHHNLNIARASNVFQMAILSIVVGAPFSALVLKVLGPRFVRHDKNA